VKRIFAFLIFASYIVVLFLLSSQKPSYAKTPTVTLADAIYADLATRQALDNVSIFYSDGKTSDDIKLNETRHWLPASTVKTFAAIYAFKLIADGKIHLSDYAIIDSKNEVTTELVTNQLPTLSTGDTVTIDRLLQQMITQSDNTAFNQLLDILGRDNITTYIQSLGLIHSHIGSKLNLDDTQTQYEYDTQGYGVNTTTAEDYAKAFELIKQNKIPGARDLFAILKQQKINNMIPLYLPKDVVCAHKTGDLNPLFHDGGICQDKKGSYVLTIFTNYGSPELLAHISQLVYTKNFNLVGATLSKQSIGDVPSDTQPLDPLVMQPVSSNVLAASTLNFPVPDLSPADLGITPGDLSIKLKDSDLPHVFIPADSPLHGISDAWQITQKAFALGAQGRRTVDINTAKLALAETKDLIQRGKTQEAQAELHTIQTGIATLTKDPSIAQDPAVQNALEAISETRFSLLGKEIQNTTGDQKLNWIKETSDAAQKQIQQQHNIPAAENAINPTQKILSGTVIKVTNKDYTIKTAGQQIITIPNSPEVTIKQTSISELSPTPSLSISEEVSPSPRISIVPRITATPAPITVGSTIAVAGTQRGKTFAASVIVPNVPKEFIAPEPVTVAKVNLKEKTMVTIEGGVYTQVNINKDTIIRGQDTTIPLGEIKQGDVVVVHGQPLTQETPTPTSIPTITSSTSLSPTNTQNAQVTTSPKHSAISITPNVTSPTLLPTHASQATSPTPGKISPTISQTLISPSITKPVVANQPILSGRNKPITITPVTNKNTITPQPNSPPAPITPKIIQSTSIQVIEKKQDIPSSARIPTQAPSQPKPQNNTSGQNPPEQPKSQPPQPPAQTNTQSTKTDTKKK